MTDWMSQPLFWRLSFSLGGLALFFGLGLLLPFRQTDALKNPKRWTTNLIFSFGNGILVKLLIPIGLMQLASNNYGSPLSLESLNFWPQVILGVVILDFVIYWQHRFFHVVPLFWRLHRMHHSDIDLDATSAGRFHPIEIFLSFGIKVMIVIGFGINPIAILVFEILLNFSSLFNHSNIQFPKPIESILRWLVITPDLHRIHHSVYFDEMNRNFGFSISLWDRLFGSYRGHSKVPQTEMRIGLNKFREPSEQGFVALLKQPFV